MYSKASVTIDASVLAVPLLDCSPEDAFQYVDTLLDWSQLLKEPWVVIYMSERASEALIQDGLFPLRNHLNALFCKHGIEEYSVNDIATIVDRLLTLTPSFETYYRIKDVLPEQLETDPNLIQLTTHKGLQSDLARCVTLFAILRAHCSLNLGSHSLILRNAPAKVIKVRAQIHDFEHTRDDISVLPCPPDFFEGDVLICDNFRGLLDCLDESAILVEASDDVGVELAIRIALFKHDIIQGDEPNWGSARIPKLGIKFRKRCQHCCAEQRVSLPTSILRSIVETVKGLNLSDVHALRIGVGGGAPDRLRGRDKAQRRDIDNEFHLHYWECSEGAIELASVVYHNDFSIPE